MHIDFLAKIHRRLVTDDVSEDFMIIKVLFLFRAHVPRHFNIPTFAVGWNVQGFQVPLQGGDVTVTWRNPTSPEHPEVLSGLVSGEGLNSLRPCQRSQQRLKPNFTTLEARKSSTDALGIELRTVMR